MTGASINIHFDGEGDTLDNLVRYIKDTPGATIKEMREFPE